MKFADTNYDNSETGCCARFEAAPWDEKEVTWTDKPFLREHVREFLHIPLNYGSVITRSHNAVEAAAAFPADPLSLTDEVSPWGSDLYMAVEGDVPGATVETLSGRFLTKVFDGPYRHVGRFAEEMDDFARSRGHEIDKLYFYYTTCPKCAKRLGKNPIVLFARIHDA